MNYRRWPIPNLRFNKMSFRDKLPEPTEKRRLKKITIYKLRIYASGQRIDANVEAYNPKGFEVRGRDLRTGRFISIENVLLILSRQYSEFN